MILVVTTVLQTVDIGVLTVGLSVLPPVNHGLATSVREHPME